MRRDEVSSAERESACWRRSAALIAASSELDGKGLDGEEGEGASGDVDGALGCRWAGVWNLLRRVEGGEGGRPDVG